MVSYYCRNVVWFLPILPVDFIHYIVIIWAWTIVPENIGKNKHSGNHFHFFRKLNYELLEKFQFGNNLSILSNSNILVTFKEMVYVRWFIRLRFSKLFLISKLEEMTWRWKICQQCVFIAKSAYLGITIICPVFSICTYLILENNRYL